MAGRAESNPQLCQYCWHPRSVHLKGAGTSQRGACAVYQLDELVKGNIAFAQGNSWRGDRYEDVLRPALEEFLKEKGTNRLGPFAIGLLMLCCLFPSLCQAEPLIISQSAFVIAQASDLHSTHLALASGRGHEGNPVMAHEPRRVALKAGATAGIVWASNRIARTRPRLARVFLYSCAAGIGTLAARNYQIGRDK